MSGGTFWIEYENVVVDLDVFLRLVEFDGDVEDTPLLYDDDWLSERFTTNLWGFDETPTIIFDEGLVKMDGQLYVGEAKSEVEWAQEFVKQGHSGSRGECFYDGDGEQTWRIVKEEDGTVSEHYPVEVWPTDPRDDADSKRLAWAIQNGIIA